MSDVTKHGAVYFKEKEIVCPECKGTRYSIQHIFYTLSKPAGGIYQLTCSYCGCEWQEVLDD